MGGRDPFSYLPFARRDTFPGSARTAPVKQEGLAVGHISCPSGRVSARRVHDLLQTLGLTLIDRNRVSRIFKELGEVVGPFRNRPLEANALSFSRIRSARRCATTIAA
jgi:hypothetical protein